MTCIAVFSQKGFLEMPLRIMDGGNFSAVLFAFGYKLKIVDFCVYLCYNCVYKLKNRLF